MWVKQEKTLISRNVPAVRVRSSGIAFNVKSRKHYDDIDIGSHVVLFFDDDLKRLGFKFHKFPQHESYKVTSDGGGKFKNTTSGGVWIACGKYVTSNPQVAALLSVDAPQELYLDEEEGIYFILLGGAMEYNLADRPVSASEKGVYEYSSDGEVVYIGRGSLKSRFSSTDRVAWLFDKISYSLVGDEQRRCEIESALLDAHQKTYQRLPIYNRVSGERKWLKV